MLYLIGVNLGGREELSVFLQELGEEMQLWYIPEKKGEKAIKQK